MASSKGKRSNDKKQVLSYHHQQTITCPNSACNQKYSNISLRVKYSSESRFFVNVQEGDQNNTIPRNCETCAQVLGTKTDSYPLTLTKALVGGLPLKQWVKENYQTSSGKKNRSGKSSARQKGKRNKATEFNHPNQARAFVESTKQKLSISNDISKLSTDNWKFLLDYKELEPATVESVLEIYQSDNFVKSAQEHKMLVGLALLLESRFFGTTVPKFLRTNVVPPSDLEKLISFVEFCFRFQPQKACEHISWLLDLREKTKSLTSLQERCSEIISLRDQIESGHIPATTNGQDGNEERAAPIVQIECYPMQADLKERDAHLVPNHIDPRNPWSSAHNYICGNFRLLREDYLEDIRTGLNSYLEGKLDDRDMNIFEQVRFLHTQAEFSELAFIVSLKLTQRQKKRKLMKNLMPGSLVILLPTPKGDANVREELLSSTDPHTTGRKAIYAVVSRQEAFKGKQRKKPDTSSSIHHLCINLLHGEQVKDINLNSDYLMVESPCYYRAVEPVLKSLKLMDPNRLPFQEELLCQGDLNSQTPDYIRDHPQMNLRHILNQDALFAYGSRTFDVTQLHRLPSFEHTIFDDSQYEAFKNILSKRISCIRGPPGCGKTYLGAAALKVLHSHLRSIREEAPILVITYTNHALDAFIEPLLPSIPKIVRVGGRSKSDNPLLEKRILHNLVRERGTNAYRHKWDLKQAMSDLCQQERSLVRLSKMENNLFDYCQQFEPHLIGIVGNLSFDQPGLFLSPRKAFDFWLKGDLKGAVKAALQKKNKKKKKEDAMIAKNFFAVLQQLDDTVENDDNDSAEASEEKKESSKKAHEHSYEQARKQVFDEAEKREFDVNHQADLEEIQEQWKTVAPVKRTHLSSKTADQDVAEGTDDSLDDDPLLEQVQEADQKELLQNRLAELGLLDEDVADLMLTSSDATDDLMAFSGKGNRFRNMDPQTLWNLQMNQRGQLLRRELQKEMDAVQTLYSECYADLQQKINVRNDEIEQAKFEVLSSSHVIAMTSTCAAINHNLIQKLGVKVCMIEEAAELMEPQVLACLNDRLEHLIMIADEKQLRPKCNSYRIATKYHLEISMFERLILNGYTHQTILTQQRMRPSISSIVSHFYENELRDHPSVFDRPDVPGVSHNIAFISHNEPESNDGRSHSNKFEAEYSVRLAQYLSVQEGYSPKDITILVAYKGQFFTIRKLVERRPSLKGLRVDTIDQFQGEENRIIILSFVRSGEKMGFVKIQNRIIVALSRAREGMFILGNSDLLRRAKDWYQVFKLFEQNDDVHVGSSLMLHCPRHPTTATEINGPNDFLAVSHGGCQLRCPHRFECGHQCPMKCHALSQHANMKCLKPCTSYASCGEHQCASRCHPGEECPPCEAAVRILLPCGHHKSVACCERNEDHDCLEQCAATLPCGHKCTHDCWECSSRDHSNVTCRVRIISDCSTCGKSYPDRCNTRLTRRCPHVCSKNLACGDRCSGKCGTCSERGHCEQKCVNKCDSTLICNHKCSGNHACTEGCPKCERSCERSCSHTSCSKTCSEICTPCMEPCEITCKHSKCSKRCGDLCDRKRCDKRCSKRCRKCRLQCHGLCGEPCPPCRHCESNDYYKGWKCTFSQFTLEDLDDGDLVYQLGCGHTFMIEYLDQYMLKDLTSDGHVVVQEKGCPNCRQIITLASAPRYQKVIKTQWIRIDRIKKKMEEEEKLRMLQSREAVVSAVQGNYSSGRWFSCPNGHPYFIGECGGAMEESKCADCGAAIGGTHHTLRADNSLASDIDGATQAAWPTALNR